MKAAWYTKNGEARDVLTVGELPVPACGPGEVRVRIHSSGVNPSDVKSRRGRPLIAERVIPHSDGAGVIDAVGDAVPAQRIGQRVWLWNGQWQRASGTAAEYIVLPSQQAVPLPDSVGFDVGACMGIPGLTAFHAVQLLGDIEGKTVLVIGASSAVGHYAVQFACRKGARVIGTVGSADKARHGKEAGASNCIQYKTEPVVQRVKELTRHRGADYIIDMDFSSTIRLVGEGLLAPHGTMVCYGSNDMGDVSVPFRGLMTNAITLRFFLVYSLTAEERRTALDGLGKLLAEGSLRHTIGARYSLDEIAAAHEAVEQGSVLGNVVLDVVAAP